MSLSPEERGHRQRRGRGLGVIACIWICGLVSASAGASGSDSTYLADLAEDEREALASSAHESALPVDPRELLERIFLLRPAYRFDVDLAVVDTDRRWFRITPSGEPGTPLLEIQRWPGDTTYALYVLSGARSSAQTGSDPPVPGATFEGPPRVSEGRWWWTGTLETASGARLVGWEERAVPGAELRLGILMVPGDAGLGSAARGELYVELQALLDRTSVNSESWASAAEIAVAGEIVLPRLSLAPDDSDERTDSWQIVRGHAFTLGLPPGVRSRRIYSSVPGPSAIPGGLLWLRGRFTNADGVQVVIGDGSRGGYLAEVHPADSEWLAGKTAPRGAPDATWVAGAPFDLAVERTAATSAMAERWLDPRFEGGEWLIFRMKFDFGGIEIGLPVAQGRQSEALFWIPLTWRTADQPPAPPPIDPAKRFGIRFDRLTPAGRKRNPWIEGYLVVPGLRLELPVGWWPVANLRSDDGFPVQLLDSDGRQVGRITHADFVDLELSEASGWEAIKKASRYQAAQAFENEHVERIYASRSGDAFLLNRNADMPPVAEEWERLVNSALLTRGGN